MARREDRDLQRQRRQRPAARAAALAGRGAARHRLPAGTEGAAGEVSRGRDPRCRLWRDLARAEELERRRHPGARRQIRSRRGAACPAIPRTRRAATSRRRSTACWSAASICPTAIPRPGPKFDYKLALVRAADRPMPRRFLRAARRSCWPAITTSCRPISTSTSRSAGSTTRCSGPRCATAFRRARRQGLDRRAAHDCIRTRRIYTFWDYFRNAYARDAGLRIDHLLLSPAVASRLEAGRVDREVRGWEKTSDHAPTWVELAEAPAPRRRRPQA